MTDFKIINGSRFVGDFTVAAVDGYEPNPGEKSYLELLHDFLNALAKDCGDEAPANQKPLLSDQRTKLRNNIIKQLQMLASKFVNGKPEDEIEIYKEIGKIGHLWGIFDERCSAILGIPFEVLPLPRGQDGKPNRPIYDIEILTYDGAISAEQQRFKVDIDNTLRVIKVVLSDRRPRFNWARSVLHRASPSQLQVPHDDMPQISTDKVSDRKPGMAFERAGNDISRRLDDYLFALLGLAQVGLMNKHPTQTPFAELALKGLQQEFVDREAGYVKNSYLVRLGTWSFLVFASGFLLFYLVEFTAMNITLERFRGFFLLASGAALGTWLSFSLRRVNLKFDDLAALEDDRLNPGIRVLFVVSLTIVVGLLFWAQAIMISIGNFSSNFHYSGVNAMLIGVLCGIAERGLATAVTKRAQEFAASIDSVR
jgi:hypothetical protein